MKTEHTSEPNHTRRFNGKYLAILILALILALIAIRLIGGSPDKKETALKTVLEQMYNCPDRELIQLRDQLTLQLPSDIDAAGDTAYPDGNVFIDKLYSKYHPYFTDKAYEAFLKNRYPGRYQFDAADRGYIIKTEQIKITRKEVSAYSFALHLKYQSKDGTEQTILINGSAEFSDDSKISSLVFEDDLLNILNNSR